MSSSTPTPRKLIAEQAAELIVRIDEGSIDDADNTELMNWLSKSPIHIDEFLLASAMWRQLDGLQGTVNENIDALVKKARQNVIPITESTPDLMVQDSRKPSRRRFQWVAAAASVLLCLGLLISPQDTSNRIATDVGEQLTFILDDGTIVHLNTLSELQIAFSEEIRHVDLLRGEAMFSVAKDVNRPFRVASGLVTVRALGTKFNVYQNNGTTYVTVVEGKVSVLPEAEVKAMEKLNRPLNLNVSKREIYAKGEQAIADDKGNITRVVEPSLEKAVAWRDRRLVFQGEPLVSIASEFNRYNQRKLEVQDEELKQRSLIATFNADDPESLLSFLEKDPGIEVFRGESHVLIRMSDRQ